MFTFCKARWARQKKNGKKIKQLEWPKCQKPKDENMGWMKQKTTEQTIKQENKWISKKYEKNQSIKERKKWKK